MALIHNGKTPPFMERPIRPGERKWYYGSWSERLASGESIITSNWSVPTGMTIIDTITNITCSDSDQDGELVEKCNGVLIENTLSSGEYYISDTVTTTDGETETSGFYLRARDFTTV